MVLKWPIQLFWGEKPWTGQNLAVLNHLIENFSGLSVKNHILIKLMAFIIIEHNTCRNLSRVGIRLCGVSISPQSPSHTCRSGGRWVPAPDGCAYDHIRTATIHNHAVILNGTAQFKTMSIHSSWIQYTSCQQQRPRQSKGRSNRVWRSWPGPVANAHVTTNILLTPFIS